MSSLSFRHAALLAASVSLLGLGGCISPMPRSLSATEQAYAVSLNDFVHVDRQLTDRELAGTLNPRMASLAQHLRSRANAIDREMPPIARRAGTLGTKGDLLAGDSNALDPSGAIIVIGRGPGADQAFVAREMSLRTHLLAGVTENIHPHDGGNAELRFLSVDIRPGLVSDIRLLQAADTRLVTSLN